MQGISAVLLSWLIILILKALIASLRGKKLVLSAFAKPGGMPSAHSGLTASLATVVALQEGVLSSAFLIALVLGLIVMHDSVGRRLFKRHTVIEVLAGAVLGAIISAVLYTSV